MIFSMSLYRKWSSTPLSSLQSDTLLFVPWKDIICSLIWLILSCSCLTLAVQMQLQQNDFAVNFCCLLSVWVSCFSKQVIMFHSSSCFSFIFFTVGTTASKMLVDCNRPTGYFLKLYFLGNSFKSKYCWLLRVFLNNTVYFPTDKTLKTFCKSIDISMSKYI